MQTNLKSNLRTFLATFLMILSVSVMSCGSNSSESGDNGDLPGVVMLIYAIETANEDETLIGASAYSVDNFNSDIDNLDFDGADLTTGLMNYIEFHFDRSLEAWVTLDDGNVDRTEVYVSSIAASGLADLANDLFDLWSVSRVEPGELYHLDFTDNDGAFYTGSMPAEEFVGITNHEDGDDIEGDELALEWNKNLVQGEISIGLDYTDSSSGQEVSEYMEDIANTGTYTLDVSDVDGEITITFYHTIEQPDAPEFGSRFGLFLAHRTIVTLNH